MGMGPKCAAVAAAALFVSCGNGSPDAKTSEIANPASEYCADHDGREETRKDSDGGEYGVCVFEDGSECESFAYMRGECKPGDERGTPSATP